jgi:hypothetical protein
MDALWDKKLQRARYEAERAERQYHAVEPENRLVARTVERAWEEKLEAERALRRSTDRTRTAGSSSHRCRQNTIRELASDLPKLWSAEHKAIRSKVCTADLDRTRRDLWHGTASGSTSQ